MGKSKKPAKPTVQEELTSEEKQFRIIFDFAYYLECLPKAPVGGATILLRQYLKEKGYLNE